MWSIRYTNFMKHKYFFLGFLVLIGYLLPYYILGENTHIRVHDNLDSNIVWYKLLVESGQIFALTDTALPNVINGLPRSALASGLDAMVWLYIMYEPMTAYIIGQTIMRIAALFGMYLLLKNFILPTEKPDWIPAGAALAFAMLPFWPSGMLSIAGLPLILFVFLTIRKFGRQTPKGYWAVLTIFPFFSNFVLTMVFFLGVMGVLWIIDWIRKKMSNWTFFTSLALMTTIYIIKNFLLISSMFFDSGFTSHREELSLGHKDLAGTFDLFVHNFVNGHTHDMAVHTTVILPVVGIAFLVAAYRNLKPKMLLVFFLANAVLSLWYAFWYWEGLRVIKDQIMVVNTFNFSRIHFFDPAVWYICFALALVIFWKHLRFGKLLAIALIVMQCFHVFVLNEENKYSQIGTPTFKEFYAEELFEEIEKSIDKDQSDYRIVSIGMHPTIAQYNGFYTLDTYNNSFPLEYKHKFREIVAPELEKNSEIKSYFDTWGGRLYMYTDELGKNYMFTKNSDKAIENLDIDTEALKDLGGDYIFSAVPIENHKENGLEFEESFVKEDLPWKIWVYRVV